MAPKGDILTVDEAAKLLRISKKTLRRAISHQEVRGVRRFGAVTRVSREGLMQWMANGCGDVKKPNELFDVKLMSSGATKIEVIRTIREITGLGLKEAKDLTDCVPSVVAARVPSPFALVSQRLLRGAGAEAVVTSAKPIVI